MLYDKCITFVYFLLFLVLVLTTSHELTDEYQKGEKKKTLICFVSCRCWYRLRPSVLFLNMTSHSSLAFLSFPFSGPDLLSILTIAKVINYTVYIIPLQAFGQSSFILLFYFLFSESPKRYI